MIKISKLDHLVLTVNNIDTSCDFYSHVLGMEIVTFGENRKALTFGDQKFNLHEAGKAFEPKADKPTPGAIDLCLITPTPIKTVIEALNQHHITIEQGPIERTGATGKLLSVYIRDPDNNLIELANHVQNT